MPSPAARPLSGRQRRALRGGVSSGVAVLLAAVSHSVGGGLPPDLLLVIAAGLLAWPAATLLAASRLGLPGLLLGSVVAQSILHVGFALTAGAEPVAGGGAHHHAELVLGPAGTSLSLPDGRMLTAHAIAALLAFVVLGFGRRAVGVVRRGVRLAARRVDVAHRSPIAAPRPATALRLDGADAVWTAVLRRRGPPLRSLPTAS
ncbi:hypothetical protein [Microbacterium sp. SORGH_AS_0888]|uniref:hypothetical protein n=1 Tax=Microbacterium sp. SORGH_AS_0888 TaxID=3041791 RepID=UPI002786FF87|nr:hypothetical protein [Microbacterium sp. SORGH_AS_0888]MDQ1128018.1 hypothetical protein [Microbacterium sp. SORGH_AS_0888]